MPLVSKEKKFVFVHIYKTGGTTLRSMLKEQTQDMKVVIDEHGTMVDLINDGFDFTGYKSFAVVRNPYDWLVSLYSYIRMPIGHPDYETAIKQTFSEFLLWLVNVGMKRERGCGLPLYRRQIDFISDRKGHPFVDNWYRFEDLFKSGKRGTKLVNKVLVKHGLEAQKEVPKLMVSKRPKGFIGQYTPNDIRLVNVHFDSDFYFFDYDMRIP